MGAHVNDALSGFQDLSRDAVGKIGFANTGVAGNKKIAARMAVKGGDEPTAAAEDLSHVLPGRQSAVPFRPVRIIIQAEVLKILHADQFPQVGLIIQHMKDVLLKTVTFFRTDVAGIPAVRAGIDIVQIIRRVLMYHQQLLLNLGNIRFQTLLCCMYRTYLYFLLCL